MLLDRRPPVQVRWGLERTQSMLAALGDPHRIPRIVHVGGTNGKGTTAACVESILRAAGCRTGLYTSPHLVEFAERIRVAGALASSQLLQECAAHVLPLAERHDATFFEATTVLAFEVFRRARCDTVIAEVGLGGRLDATNVVDPGVTVITAVDLDHSDYLGDSLPGIAAEKAGILKAGVPAVAGRLREEALAVVERRCLALETPLDLLGRDLTAAVEEVSLAGTSFVFQSPDSEGPESLRTGLIGRHQADNAALAIRAAEHLVPKIGREKVREGLAHVRWPGRFEVLKRTDGTWVLDIAHNTAAVERLAGLLDEVPLPRPRVVVVAILGDKPWRDMLAPLFASGAAGVFTIAPSAPPERRWDPLIARHAVKDAAVDVVLDFEMALGRARELAGNGTVVVTGSAYTVGDATRFLSL